VKARRAPNKVTSSVPIQLLSKEDISQLGIQNMADAVRRFAGANVKDYGGIGGVKTVSVRNMGAAHTAVSYDGMLVSNCQAGQIDIGRFSLDNVEMLSLAIGQDDNLLQSARLFASGAVLNIETEKPTFKGSANKTFQIKLNGGSFGYVSPAIRWWQKINKSTKIAVNGNYLHADGNYPFELVNGKYTTTEKRNNSTINSYQGEGNLYHTFKDNSTMEVKSYYYYSKRGLPGSVILYNPISNEKLWDENFFAQTKYKKIFSSQFKMLVQAKYNHSWNKYEDKGVEYVDNTYQAIHRQNEYSISASGLYQPLSNLSIALSQDGYINALRSNLPECPFPTRYTSLTALNARWLWKRISITGTLVNTFITEKVKVGDQPNNLKRLSPSISANIKPWGGEDLYIRLLYKSTFRTPTFNDLYYYRLGNRSLRPEKANEYNLGVAWNKRLFPFMDYFSMTIDGYYNNVKDKIVAFPTTYAWRMANYGKVHITGMDVTLASAAKINKNINLIFSGAYTLQKAIDLTDPDAKNYKDQLPYTPEHSGNVSLIAETPIVNVGYSIVGVSKRYSLSQNIPENQVDGYLEHSLSLSHRFLLKNYSLQLKAEIINLTNAQYDVIQYYPMPGRSWRISGIFNF
jgi:outer membrane cobalamin receptor